MKTLLLVIYFFTIFSLLIFSYAFIDPNLIFLDFLYTGFYHKYRISATAIYVILVISLTVCYLGFLKLYSMKMLKAKEIKILLITTGLGLVLSYPAMLSYDIFNYIATAKVTYFYKENPYVLMPIEFLNDPLLLFMHAPNKTAVYGPIWILVTFFPFILSFNNFIVCLIMFKLLITLFYFITLVVLYKISKSLHVVIMFSLHPLVLMESLISGHNDIVMMGLALIGIYFLHKKKIIPGWVMLFLSIGIKFATIFLIPAFLYTTFKILTRKRINWDEAYSISFLGMLTVFLLSPLREEMYPWYSIWFFLFIALLYRRKNLMTYGLIFLFGLSLRYIPFMYYGIHSQLTAILKIILSVSPLIICALGFGFRGIWKRGQSVIALFCKYI